MLRISVASIILALAPYLAAQEELGLAAAKEAWAAYRAGQTDLARTMARQTLDFDPGLSDPYVILALLPPQTGSLRENATHARRALKNNSFHFAPARDAVEVLARFDLEGWRLSEAEALLASRPETALDAVLSGLYIQVLLAQGRRDAALRLTRQARQRFPSHRAILPGLLQFPREFPETESLLLEALADTTWRDDHADDLLHHLPSTPLDLAWVLTRLQRSALRGHPDLTARLLGARLITWPEALAVWEEKGPPHDLQTAWALVVSVPQEFRSRWRHISSRANLTGYLIRDPYTRRVEKRSFTQGHLASVRSDKDGDGFIEEELILTAGVPSEWRESLLNENGRQTGTLRLRWSAYPYLDFLEMTETYETGSHRKLFTFVPKGTRFEMAGLLRPLGKNSTDPLVLPLAYPGMGTALRPEADRVLPLAVRLREYDSAGMLRRRWSFEDGRVYLLEEDTRGAGYRDAVYLFAGGELRKVYRDPEGSGRWTILQTLRRGQPVTTLQADEAGRVRLLWQNMRPGLFLWSDRARSETRSVFQEGLVNAKLSVWNLEALPDSLADFPQPPFSSLENWQ